MGIEVKVWNAGEQVWSTSHRVSEQVGRNELQSQVEGKNKNVQALIDL